MDILYDLYIVVLFGEVFDVVLIVYLFDCWWIECSVGDFCYGVEYEFVFGDVVWKVFVVECL